MSKRNKPRRSKLELDKYRKKLDIIGKKVCRKCKLLKDKSQFSIEHGNILSSWCKSCHAEYSALYRKRDGYRKRNAKYMSKYRKRKRLEAKKLKENS